jgi:Outer membrane lipoprotein-sorting protein
VGAAFMRRTREALFVLLLGAALVRPAPAQTASPLTLQQIVSRMQAAELAEHDRPSYTLLRQYRLSGADPSATTTQVLAEVNYVPPSNKEFSIRKTEGNERGEKIVRRVLEHEAKMAREPVRSDFCTDNYGFALLGQESLNGKQTYVLQLSPKHQATELLRGKAWVDTESFLVVRVKGEPAKNPSWWIKDLTIAIDYGRADGVWLPLATSATADLRIIGTHVLTSKDVEVHAVTENAKLSPSHRTPQPSRSGRSIDQAAVWVPR